MTTRRSFLVGLGLGLFTASAVWADPPVAVPVPAADALDVVRQFLAYRDAKNWPKAYALLSRDTQTQIPYDQFAQGISPLASPSENGMTPILTAVSVLFIDPGDRLGYQFQLVGVAPEDPHIVLVSAQPPPLRFYRNPKSLLLRIVTVPDSQTRALRIEMMSSFHKTDPMAFEKTSECARQAVSLFNLKQMSHAMLEYVLDHDEQFPSADQWVDAISPYLTGNLYPQLQKQLVAVTVFHDPSAPHSQKWSYAFNSNLSRLTLARIDDAATTVLLFESNANIKNAADTGQSIPRPGRHGGGTCYAFADGHCEWFPDNMPLADRRKSLSFSPKGR